MFRTASISSQTVIQKSGKVDYSYQEEIIRKCMSPLPDPYFVTMDFVTHFLNQCDEMCTMFKRMAVMGRQYSRLRAPSPSLEIPCLRIWRFPWEYDRPFSICTNDVAIGHASYSGNISLSRRLCRSWYVWVGDPCLPLCTKDYASGKGIFASRKS